MIGFLGTQKLAQVAYIVKDVVQAKQAFAEMLGMKVPDHFDGGKFEITQTEYLGQPAPKANCWMAFFTVGDGCQIELIQPNGERSLWQDYLDNHGEGLHHIAFKITDMQEKINLCEAHGMKLVQRGKYGDGSGRYAYLDANDSLHCYLELLEDGIRN